MAHLLHFKQRMSMERVSKALTCKLFATTLTKKAFTWLSQFLEGSLGSYMTFGRKLLEQYHNNHPQQKFMANLHMEQQYDENPRSYLENFMELTSQIFNLDSRQATNLFMRGLMKGSLLHEKFLEHPPYDLNELKSKAKGILRVVESIQQIAKNVAIAISQNNSRSKDPKDASRRMREEDKENRPPKDKSGNKRKGTDYSGGPSKRFKTNEEDNDCIFMIP